MGDSNLQLQWTDDQWNRVRQVVYEEARKARVAGSFLPLYGPLEPDATYVTKEELKIEPAPSGELQRISVNNTETLPLLTLEILVYLRGAQVADPELSSALTAFRRAANALARLEDSIIFNGSASRDKIREEVVLQATESKDMTAAKEAVEKAKAELATEERKFRNTRGDKSLPEATITQAEGDVKRAKIKYEDSDKDMQDLVAKQEAKRFSSARRAAASFLLLPPICNVTGANHTYGMLDKAVQLGTRSKSSMAGEALVSNVSSAIGQLEAAGHLGPFACVLDQALFLAAQTPSKDSMVLPQDRILPFLGGGALVRSSVLQRGTGMVVASGAAPIDLVVATDISVKFLQLTLEPRFVFRIYEKIALRVKEEGAIVAL